VNFLVDAQLPPALARWIASQRHQATHVFDLGFHTADDPVIWERARNEHAGASRLQSWRPVRWVAETWVVDMAAPSIAPFILTTERNKIKTLTLLAVALVAWSGLVGCTTTQPPTASAGTGVVLSPQDVAEVRAAVAEFVNIWNHDDMTGMHDLVTEDALWILRNGNVWRGKGEVYKFNDMVQRTPGSPWSIEKMEVRSLASQVAVATVKMKFSNQGDVFHTRDSFVMAKRAGAWKIVHYHSTTIHPDVAKSDRPDFGVTK
jgi:uncharacterized protein (TIGR02246 family)